MRLKELVEVLVENPHSLWLARSLEVQIRLDPPVPEPLPEGFLPFLRV